MKLAKRLLSVALALLMVFALVACAGDPAGTDTNTKVEQTGNTDNPGTDSTGNTDTGPQPPDFVLPDRPTDETNGQNYIIIQHADIANPFGYSQDSVMGLQVADRLAEVQDLYGCTLEFYQIAYNEQFASQLQALQFADDGGDLIFSDNNAMLRRALGLGGDESMCYDLLKFDHILNFWDMNKWGNITARECMMAGGTFYGVSPALWVDCTPLPYYTMVYNKDLVTLYGATDPQESWEAENWDTFAMVDVIKKTTNEADGIFGIAAQFGHMQAATRYSTGVELYTVTNIAADGTVEWKDNLNDPQILSAYQWLKNTVAANRKCFNKGARDWHSDSWQAHVPFNDGLCAMALTRPSTLFASVVLDGPENFGIITWAGETPNILAGYYENVYAVAIPIFAKNADHSAFLAYDLFEGLGDIETYEDVLAYYRETYFSSDLDITCLVREGAKLSYSYWPNFFAADADLMASGTIAVSVGKAIEKNREPVSTHIMPNKASIEAWRQQGKLD